MSALQKRLAERNSPLSERIGRSLERGGGRLAQVQRGESVLSSSGDEPSGGSHNRKRSRPNPPPSSSSKTLAVPPPPTALGVGWLHERVHTPEEAKAKVRKALLQRPHFTRGRQTVIGENGEPVDTRRLIMVRFSAETEMGWRMFVAPVWVPHNVADGTDWKTQRASIEQQLAQSLPDEYELGGFGDYTKDNVPPLKYHHTPPTTHTATTTNTTTPPKEDRRAHVVVNGLDYLLSEDDLKAVLDSLEPQPRYHAQKKCFGYVDDVAAKHRSFRYYIRGADVPTLERLIPDEMAFHQEGCDRMCMYYVLRNRNPPRIENVTNKKTGVSYPVTRHRGIFDPPVVHQWMLDHGHPVGTITDGLTPEDIQAHAEAHRYNHAALDITRSLILLHMPANPDKHLRTIAYTVVGDHAIPFTDPDVIESIMTSAALRLGKRRLTSYSFYGRGGNNHRSNHPGAHSEENDDHPPQSPSRGRSRSPRQTITARARVIRRGISASHDGETTSTPSSRDYDPNRLSDPDVILDVEHEDRAEEFEDIGTPDTVRTNNRKKKTRQYPLAKQRDRFVTFTKANDREFVKARLKPEYQEGSDPLMVYYYVCTDAKNVEFLYDYCIHVLCWDPTTAARSFNGHCTTLTINNVVWTAVPDEPNDDEPGSALHRLLRLHEVLHRDDPVRLVGMANYAFRMLARELHRIGPTGGTNLWDCMSQYPPNLQRLLDSHHPYHRPKLLQHTFHPPYGPPVNSRPDTPPEILVPDAERRRLDLIRSYAAALLEMDEDRDQFPIHDITNVVVPFHPDYHGHLPVGHYLVDIPAQKALEGRGIYEDWKRLCCFKPGEPRMMSHRFLKGLIHRGLLWLTDIRLACVTDDWRQQRYGTALAQGLAAFVRTVYQHVEFQDPTMAPVTKMLVNYLVGLCNGTTMPHNGNRFVFRSLEEMYQLALRIYTEDQIQNVHLKRSFGTDRYWDNTDYCHYEMTNSGLAYRSFHLQPVYNMVLENQALRLFDVVRPIPLRALIQLNVDACEYRVRPSDEAAPWVRALEQRRRSKDGCTPADILTRGLIGACQAETPKPIAKWKSYHFQYQNVRHETVVKRMLRYTETDAQNDAIPALADPEARDWVPSWCSTLRVYRPGAKVREEAFLDREIAAWFQQGEHERTGLLLTGPAGTGKTHILKRLYACAVHRGDRVVRTAFTHAACVQLGPDAMTLSALFGLDHLSDTRAILVMSRRFAAHLRNLCIDVLIVDEISMIPLDLLECLVLFHRVSSQTRIVLSGDFHQLPPVEPQRERPEGYNYFDTTDIFPYLVYDRVRRLAGHWLRLTECMRTDDPLLQEICVDPTYVTTRLDPRAFPVDPQQPIWRFVCFTNQTRKATNWYCMHRWCEAHPDADVYPFDLRDIYVHDRMHPRPTANGRTYAPRFDADYYANEFDAMMMAVHIDCGNRRKQKEQPDTTIPTDDHDAPPTTKTCPRHWEYLQSFVYGVGMDVVARNTVREHQRREKNGDNSAPLIVNNRRATIVAIDPEERTVRLRWSDVTARMREARLPSENHDDATPDRDTVATIQELEDEDITLDFVDFAFNFTPGFCVTAHLAQGETIREHYGILDWNQIRQRQTMAYVAVTRASHPSLLHIVPNGVADPWNILSNADIGVNLLRKLYRVLQTDLHNVLLPWHRTPLDLYRTLRTQLIDAHHQNGTAAIPCACCRGPTKLKAYPDNDPTQFVPVVRPAWYDAAAPPTTDGIVTWYCRDCCRRNRQPIPTKKTETTTTTPPLLKPPTTTVVTMMKTEPLP